MPSRAATIPELVRRGREAVGVSARNLRSARCEIGRLTFPPSPVQDRPSREAPSDQRGFSLRWPHETGGWRSAA